MSVYLILSKITVKRINRFNESFGKMLIIGQGTDYYILVMLLIYLRITTTTTNQNTLINTGNNYWPVGLKKK